MNNFVKLLLVGSLSMAMWAAPQAAPAGGGTPNAPGTTADGGAGKAGKARAKKQKNKKQKKSQTNFTSQAR